MRGVQLGIRARPADCRQYNKYVVLIRQDDRVTTRSDQADRRTHASSLRPNGTAMTITNFHQRKITAARRAEFEQKLAELQATPPRDDNATGGHRLALSQICAYIDEFSSQLAEFDQLADVDQIVVSDLNDLGEALVRARVASGLTQAQLASRVGLQTSAINRYEANNYRSANLTRLAEISDGLDFRLVAELVRHESGG